MPTVWNISPLASTGLLCYALVLLGAGEVEAASQLTRLDRSLNTLPVAYIGGVSAQPRSQASIDMLAKMKIVIIERWEGPCWDKCMLNISEGLQCEPSCHGEMYMLDTLKRLKEANPNVATGIYQSSLYLWRFQALYGDFAAHNEVLKAVNGSVAGLTTESGMRNVPVFSFDQADAVARFGNWLENLTSTGHVDGMLLDKPEVMAVQNATAKAWQVCEWATGEEVGEHSWVHMCVPISEAVAEAYNHGRKAIQDKSIEVFTENGGFLMGTHYPGDVKVLNIKTTIAALQKAVSDALLEGVVDAILLWRGVDKRTDNGSDTSSQCSTYEVATAMIVHMQGMFLACNGWSEDFSRPFGYSLHRAAQSGTTWTRTFNTGTTVTLDEATGKAEINWAS